MMFLAENVTVYTRTTWEELALLTKNAELSMLEGWAVDQHWKNCSGLNLASGVKLR